MPREHHAGLPVCTGSADMALQVIAAERHAAYVLEQVRLGKLSADELALELGKAYGPTLRVLARAIAKRVQGASDARP